MNTGNANANVSTNGNANVNTNGNVVINPLKLNKQLSLTITSLSSSISDNINNNVIDKNRLDKIKDDLIELSEEELHYLKTLLDKPKKKQLSCC